MIVCLPFYRQWASGILLEEDSIGSKRDPIQKVYCMQMLTGLLTGLLLSAIAVVSASRLAAAESAARAEFDKSYAQYKEVVKRMYDLRDRYPSAAAEDRPAMEQKFNELLKQGNDLRPKVLAVAEKAYVENPKDETLRTMMLSAVETMVNGDDYEEALRLAKLMIENKSSDPKIYDLAGQAAFDVSKYDDAEKYLKLAAESKSLSEKGQEVSESIGKYREKWARELKFRETDAKSELPRVKLTIGDSKGNMKGDIIVELFENEAPNTVANFLSLVEKKFYDGLIFHRVIQHFMAQGGDPLGTGTGGPGYSIADECNRPNHRDHFRGSLSMAHSAAPDSNGSQFFITFVPTGHLDGKHTVFGRVVEGFDVLAKIQRTQAQGERGDTPIPGAVPDKIVKAEMLPSKREHPHQPKTLPEKK
jgi:cyclophilin family peptidyl-prolyl cis-trans isomerase